MLRHCRHLLNLACLLAPTAVGTVACTSAVPTMTAEDAHWAAQTWPDATQGQLQRGRTLYVSRCGGCHAVVPPEKHSADMWRTEIAQMAPRANLMGEDRELVLRYLVTASRRVVEARRAAGTPK